MLSGTLSTPTKVRTTWCLRGAPLRVTVPEALARGLPAQPERATAAAPRSKTTSERRNDDALMGAVPFKEGLWGGSRRVSVAGDDFTAGAGAEGLQEAVAVAGRGRCHVIGEE